MSDEFFLTGPWLVGPWQKALGILCVYAATLHWSGSVVRRALKLPKPGDDAAKARERAGMVIGKCENIITVTLVLLQQETGLALIFAAKSIVRGAESKDAEGRVSEEKASYYLGGTLVNFVWGLLMGLLARVLVTGL